jgi:hypothetical protein
MLPAGFSVEAISFSLLFAGHRRHRKIVFNLADRVEARAFPPGVADDIFVVGPMILTGPPSSSEDNHCIICPEQAAASLLET